ncbi:hypothetical protein GOP96_19780 [Vibrio cholerae]|uniref:Uncharacterized protein n=1 Tax=Vibrio cholerae TaxID=666 RepID=A0A8B5ZLN5_VIBCL|nr:hypothetical protein [Vibrio cholerae]MEB5529243.1 hypothetical protein [Vibrio cholerae]MEB5598765.1 hypothetical protein [Vibrio cholerae]NAO21166.1 hypothetical protein [Vibrio cholerae]NAO59043.1 hypothetical protein [Vibrio cholerae]
MIQFQLEKLYGLANNFNGLFLSGFKCKVLKLKHNKRLKRDCQRVAFPVPLSRGGYGCCV